MIKEDLEKRCFDFALKIINLTLKIHKNAYFHPILNQLIRSSSSIGANVCEAQEAESKKEFIHKIIIAKKEARETRYWLRLIFYLYPKYKKIILKLGQEAKELNLILNKIAITAKKNLK